MSEVREYFAARNEFAFHQTSLVDGNDAEHIYRDAFLAWWMSARPRPSLRACESLVCALKLRMQRGLRNTIAAIRRFRMIMINLVDRGLIAETNVTKIKQEQSRYDISLEVGDPEDMEEGLGAFLNFSVVDNRACLACVRSACRIVKASLRCPLPPAASTSFQAMALPAGIGSALTVDFIQRTGTDEMTVSTAVRMITAVIDEHLKSELEKIPYFHSWRGERAATSNNKHFRLKCCHRSGRVPE
jgi:hypothetical protein